MSNSVGLNLVPRSRAAKAAWKAACGNMAEDSTSIPLGLGDNIIGRAYFPGSDCLWLGIPSCAKGIREWHVRLRTESRNQETVAIHAYAPVRIREISGEVKEFTQGGQGCLAVGQMLELDVDDVGRDSRCLYYYALELACSASFPTTPVTSAAPKSRRSNAARRSGLASVSASCGNSNDIRRFLKIGVTDIFAKFENRGEPYQGAGGKVKTQPLFQGALRSDGDDDEVEVMEQPMRREASPSRVFPRRRKRGRDQCLGVNPFVPSELVDLCDTDDSADAGDSPSKAILVESDDEEDADRDPRSVVELDDKGGGPAKPGSSAFIIPSDGTNHPEGSMASLVVEARRDISSDSTSSAVSAGFCSAGPVSDSARRVESVTIKEGEMDGGHDVSSPCESRVMLDVKHSSRSPFGMDRLAAKSSMAPLGNHRQEQDRSETSSPPCIDTTLFVNPVTDLKIIGRTSPVIAFPVMERLLVCGSRPPGGLSDMLVSELLKSTCETRTECLRRQLHYMLNASSQPWHPERNLRGVPGRWLEGVMLVITRNSALRNRTNRAAIAKLDAHVAVLELIVTFVGRSRDVPAESGQLFAAVSAGAEGETVGASRVDKLRELFPWGEDSKNQTVQKKNASRAVAKCAGWAVELWRLTISVKSLKSGRRRGQGPRELTSMVHTRARLSTGRLLAEVVDSCGLSLQEACAVVLDELKYYRSDTSSRGGYATGRDTWESDEDNEYVGDGYSSGLLDAAALGGFIRSLCGFPLCAVLARQLLLDKCLVNDAEGKLERLLTRSSRHPGRGGMLLLPL